MGRQWIPSYYIYPSRTDTGHGQSEYSSNARKKGCLNYNNNRIHILGKAEVTVELKGWVTQQNKSVIAGNRQPTLGRDLMGSLGVTLVQMDCVMTVTEENTNAGEEQELDGWKSCFCTLFLKMFTRIGHIHTRCQSTSRVL